MTKKNKISLDDLDLPKNMHGEVAKDELIKIRNLKFSGKQSKLPSLIARQMGEKMLNDMDTGTWINTSKMEADTKKQVIIAFKKDFNRISRTALNDKKISEPLRIRTVDQGDKVSFYYEVKRKGKNGPVVDKTDEVKKKKNGKK